MTKEEIEAVVKSIEEKAGALKHLEEGAPDAFSRALVKEVNDLRGQVLQLAKALVPR